MNSLWVWGAIALAVGTFAFFQLRQRRTVKLAHAKAMSHWRDQSTVYYHRLYLEASDPRTSPYRLTEIARTPAADDDLLRVERVLVLRSLASNPSLPENAKHRLLSSIETEEASIESDQTLAAIRASFDLPEWAWFFDRTS